MNTKNNQRFQQTEIKLEASMLELMKHTELEKITVKRICETAKVNRSTFYAHFVDIYDMLRKMETHLWQELLDSYPSAGGSEAVIFSAGSFLPFLRHIKKHQYFYRIALQAHKDFPLVLGYEQKWHLLVKPQYEPSSARSEAELMYYYAFFQAGLTQVLKHWVDAGCKESEQKMAQMLHRCVPDALKPAAV